MNLTEYLEQTDPQRQQKVVLNNLEFDVYGAIKCGQDYYNSIRIKEYPNYIYVLKNGSGYLYTTDEHGNQKSKSCFFIDKLR